MHFTHALTLAVALAFLKPVMANDWVHVRLKDRLDRPQDGYCLDILGAGAELRLDLPLFVHNCKDSAAPDNTLEYTSSGQMVFPGVGSACITAFGVNGLALPGSPLILRLCGYRATFFDASEMQTFDYTEDGQFRLQHHDLCLAAGAESSVTYSINDRWRVLSLERCSKRSLTFSAWKMVSVQ